FCLTLSVLFILRFLLQSFAMIMIHIATSITIFLYRSTAHTEIYTLSLHDALPISALKSVEEAARSGASLMPRILQAVEAWRMRGDRKSTRLNSSHVAISYAVFCLKKKTINIFVCLDLLELLAIFIAIRCSLCVYFL